ncbi:MAG: sulfatase-like hydrolase/transferase [Planctomycetes bacterium]|nr:sulfatase-like hydrolase/transferase [Planctomycetota bacterium]
MIVLVADHGEELFEHGRLGHGYALSDVMLHVPLVMAGPGVPRGRRVERPVSTASLFNTLLVLAGLDLVEGEPRRRCSCSTICRLVRRRSSRSRARRSSVPRRCSSRPARRAGRRSCSRSTRRAAPSARARSTTWSPIPASSTRSTRTRCRPTPRAPTSAWVADALHWYDVTRKARPAGESGGTGTDDALIQLSYLEGTPGGPGGSEPRATARTGTEARRARRRRARARRRDDRRCRARRDVP